MRKSARVVLFLLGVFLILGALYTLSSVSNTLDRLSVVEAERDRWQRPSDVLRGLGVSEGSRVVDLGSGAGYFSLKLADLVGKRGQVIAVDLRRLSLFFLRIRALIRGEHNIRIIVGTPEDPHLPTEQADALLISNTYHEFENPELMLDHVRRALRPGGRLVILDRRPGADSTAQDHEIPPDRVEAEVRRHGFEIVRRDDRFIEQSGEEPWWLLLARRPNGIKADRQEPAGVPARQPRVSEPQLRRLAGPRR
jgi:ubiquinone/menaquinone biosynthesis C-methylase UbiE